MLRMENICHASRKNPKDFADSWVASAGPVSDLHWENKHNIYKLKAVFNKRNV